MLLFSVASEALLVSGGACSGVAGASVVVGLWKIRSHQSNFSFPLKILEQQIQPITAKWKKNSANIFRLYLGPSPRA